MILTFEEYCSEDGEFASDHGKPFASIFTQVSNYHTAPMNACSIFSYKAKVCLLYIAS